MFQQIVKAAEELSKHRKDPLGPESQYDYFNSDNLTFTSLNETGLKALENYSAQVTKIQRNK